MRVPAFVVIGGGAAGLFYVRQLRRAMEGGRLETPRIVVVDRRSDCPAAVEAGGPVAVEAADWSDWLEGRLDELDPEAQLVPYHWAPHLLVEWLARRVRRAGGTARREGEVPPQGVPFERTTRDGDRALSYATWPCPPTCIEPALCPHTKGPKDWSLAADLEREDSGDGIDDRIVFRCLHLLYGVGSIPVGTIQEAGRRLLEGLRTGPRRYLVATSSHCHALATVLEVAGAQLDRRGED